MTKDYTHQQFHMDLPTKRMDDGFFGPDSVSWKLWSHPAAIAGVTRSFVIDMVGSAAGAAALDDFSRLRDDPLGRFNRTMHYFLTVVFADTDTVAKANVRLDRLHARILGTEPLTGRPYSALDPYLRLGNHMLSWHSVFYAYDTLVGGLTQAEEDQYFKEAAIAFETIGVDFDEILLSAQQHGIETQSFPNRLPNTRDEYRQLWAASKHLICVNEKTRRTLDGLLYPKVSNADPSHAALLRLYPMLSRVALALTPRHIRHTCGLRTSNRSDYLAIQGARLALPILHRTGAYNAALQQLSPHGYEIQAQALAAPRSPRISVGTPST